LLDDLLLVNYTRKLSIISGQKNSVTVRRMGLFPTGERLLLQEGPQQYILTLNFPLKEEERSILHIFMELLF